MLILLLFSFFPTQKLICSPFRDPSPSLEEYDYNEASASLTLKGIICTDKGCMAVIKTAENILSAVHEKDLIEFKRGGLSYSFLIEKIENSFVLIKGKNKKYRVRINSDLKNGLQNQNDL